MSTVSNEPNASAEAAPSAPFELHPRLAADTFPLGDFPLCRLRLMNDAHYPWFILIPRRAGIREMYELSEADQVQLTRESATLGKIVMECCQGYKLNVAALGNQVAQLHIHHIVRYADDAAWPGPVWGRHPPKPYAELDSLALVAKLQGMMPGDFKPA